MNKLLIRLWPVFNLAGIIGISAGLILLLISVLWQLGLADLTEIFPTLSPIYAMLGSIALTFGTWFKWQKLRRQVRQLEKR